MLAPSERNLSSFTLEEILKALPQTKEKAKDYIEQNLMKIHEQIQQFDDIIMCAKKTNPDVFALIVQYGQHYIFRPENLIQFLSLPEVSTQNKLAIVTKVYQQNFLPHFFSMLDAINQYIHPTEKKQFLLDFLTIGKNSLCFSSASLHHKTDFVLIMNSINQQDLNLKDKQALLQSIYFSNAKHMSTVHWELKEDVEFVNNLALTEEVKYERIKQLFDICPNASRYLIGALKVLQKNSANSPCNALIFELVERHILSQWKDASMNVYEFIDVISFLGKYIYTLEKSPFKKPFSECVSGPLIQNNFYLPDDPTDCFDENPHCPKKSKYELEEDDKEYSGYFKEALKGLELLAELSSSNMKTIKKELFSECATTIIKKYGSERELSLLIPYFAKGNISAEYKILILLPLTEAFLEHPFSKYSEYFGKILEIATINLNCINTLSVTDYQQNAKTLKQFISKTIAAIGKEYPYLQTHFDDLQKALIAIPSDLMNSTEKDELMHLLFRSITMPGHSKFSYYYSRKHILSLPLKEDVKKQLQQELDQNVQERFFDSIRTWDELTSLLSGICNSPLENKEKFLKRFVLNINFNKLQSCYREELWYYESSFLNLDMPAAIKQPLFFKLFNHYLKIICGIRKYEDLIKPIKLIEELRFIDTIGKEKLMLAFLRQLTTSKLEYVSTEKQFYECMQTIYHALPKSKEALVNTSVIKGSALNKPTLNDSGLNASKNTASTLNTSAVNASLSKASVGFEIMQAYILHNNATPSLNIPAKTILKKIKTFGWENPGLIKALHASLIKPSAFKRFFTFFHAKGPQQQGHVQNDNQLNLNDSNSESLFTPLKQP